MSKKLEKYYQKFYNWLNDEVEKGYYPPLGISTKETEKLVKKIVRFYEKKYPDHILQNDDILNSRSTFKDLNDLELSLELTTTEGFLLIASYRSSCWEYDEDIKESLFAIHLPNKDDPIKTAIIFADKNGRVKKCNIHGLDGVISEKNTTDLRRIYLELDNKKHEYNYKELKKCIDDHEITLMLRMKIISLAALSLQHSKNTSSPLLGNIRVQRLIKDFNYHYYGLNLNENIIDVKEPQIKTKLQTIYDNYLYEYHLTGTHPHPSELLALLLLPEKDKFLPVTATAGEFYELYKEDINLKINRLVQDFHITRKEMIKYIEETVIYSEETYEEDEIWHVFCHGFGALQWGIIYAPNWSPEKIYDECSVYWNKNPLKHESRTKKKARKKIEAKMLGQKH